MQSSHSLQKLSVRASNLSGYGRFITDKLVNSICENGSTLQVLDLAYCELTFQHIKLIFEKCVELRELNLDGMDIPNAANFLAETITTKIEKLNISWWKFNDENVKTLVSRCTKISALNLQATKVTNNSLKYIIDKLGPTLEELHLTTYNYDNLMDLKVMPRFKILNTRFGLTYDEHMSLYFPMETQSMTINEKLVNVAANISPENGIWEIKIKGILA